MKIYLPKGMSPLKYIVYLLITLFVLSILEGLFEYCLARLDSAGMSASTLYMILIFLLAVFYFFVQRTSHMTINYQRQILPELKKQRRLYKLLSVITIAAVPGILGTLFLFLAVLDGDLSNQIQMGLGFCVFLTILGLVSDKKKKIAEKNIADCKDRLLEASMNNIGTSSAGFFGPSVSRDNERRMSAISTNKGIENPNPVYGINITDLFKDAEYVLPETADPEIEKIYNSIHELFRIRGFYGEPRNAQVILYRIIDILSSEDTSHGKSKEELMEKAFAFYMKIQTRAAMIDMFRSVNKVIESIMALYSREYPQHITAAVLEESLRFIYNHDPKLKMKTMQLQFTDEMQQKNAEKKADI